MGKIKILFLLASVATVATMTIAGCTPKDYQLSTSCVPSAGGSIAPSSGTFQAGSKVVLNANPAQSHEFSGWTGDASGNSNPLTITVNDDKHIVASFTRITYSLQVQTDSWGGGTVQPSGGKYEAATQVKLSATPANGYRFDHWGGDISGFSNSVNILMDGNKIITAYFTKTYNLTVSCSPSGTGTVAPNTGFYDAGTSVTLTATGVFPYVFKNWTGTDNDNVNPTTLMMSSDKSVTAYFATNTPAEYTDSLVRDGSTNITGADKQPIIIRNYANAKNPTYQELLTFMKSDKTDETPYQSDKYASFDFAETLHNNAEKAGLRCAYAIVEISGSPYAINAFETTDRGIIYIDDTGKRPSWGEGPINEDKKVDIGVGYSYAPISLFPAPGWNSVYPTWGTITKIGVIQW